MTGFNIAYDNYIQNDLNLFAAAKKTSIKTTKRTLTHKQKAGVAVNVIGIACLLTGVGLLAGSLAYSDYIEKNETKDYDKYIAGKNLSRGLFYGSMGGLSAGTLGIVISIPLFVEVKKNVPVKKK